jgi:hypothetical protein
MTKQPERRRINPWGPAMHVMRDWADERGVVLEMVVAVRISLVPIGVDIVHIGGGWAFVWMELPAGFHRTEATHGGEVVDPAAFEGLDEGEDVAP